MKAYNLLKRMFYAYRADKLTVINGIDGIVYKVKYNGYDEINLTDNSFMEDLRSMVQNK